VQVDPKKLGGRESFAARHHRVATVVAGAWSLNGSPETGRERPRP
jgi:hypothetical protein